MGVVTTGAMRLAVLNLCSQGLHQAPDCAVAASVKVKPGTRTFDKEPAYASLHFDWRDGLLRGLVGAGGGAAVKQPAVRAVAECCADLHPRTTLPHRQPQPDAGQPRADAVAGGARPSQCNAECWVAGGKRCFQRRRASPGRFASTGGSRARACGLALSACQAPELR